MKSKKMARIYRWMSVEDNSSLKVAETIVESIAAIKGE